MLRESNTVRDHAELQMVAPLRFGGKPVHVIAIDGTRAVNAVQVATQVMPYRNLKGVARLFGSKIGLHAPEKGLLRLTPALQLQARHTISTFHDCTWLGKTPTDEIWLTRVGVRYLLAETTLKVSKRATDFILGDLDVALEGRRLAWAAVMPVSEPTSGRVATLPDREPLFRR